MQRKYKPNTNIKDLYKYYALMYFKEKFIKVNGELSKNTITHHESAYNIPLTLYNQIIKDYFDIISLDILEGKDFKIFERLGVIGIRKNKLFFKIDEEGELITNAPIDFKATNDLWKQDPEAKKEKVLIRHINEHTNKYIHRWYWDKHNANFTNKTAYSFIPCRKNKRLLSKILKEDRSDIDYYTRYNLNKKF